MRCLQAASISPRFLTIFSLAVAALGAGCSDESKPTTASSLAENRDEPGGLDPRLVAAGRDIFRFDTFGDETFWTDTLGMHVKIRTGLSPVLALKLGLKVDVQALPDPVRAAIRSGQGVDLNDPATTVTLLKLGAVVGVIGKVDASNTLTQVGITCALCHSTVDNSLIPGIGKRLDGWPNRDLDVGAIVALSDALTPAQKSVYNSWGPGMYDPRFNVDGQNHPVVIPPAFGLRNTAREIYTGDGPVSYWNAYVAITQMHGHGHFVDSRIGLDRNNPPDLVSSKLPALREYQFSLVSPRNPLDDAAIRGRAVFADAGCTRCHIDGRKSDVNRGVLHSPAEVGQDAAYALRSATKEYRTTPLRGLWQLPQLKGPYFHDGSAPSLEAVVDHYIKLFGLTLSVKQKADLVAYLKTL